MGKGGLMALRSLEILVKEKFFVPCLVHQLEKKNVFCLECCCSFCPICSTSHTKHHPLLQIRRYVYHEVLRLEDAEKLITCSSVQTYISNNSKVVFLKQRPKNRQFKAAASVCSVCNRILQQPFRFCSIYCKVQHLAGNKKLIAKNQCGSKKRQKITEKPRAGVRGEEQQQRLKAVSNVVLKRRKGVPYRSPLF